jgi:putative ABC transport system substrate-binding protein
MSRVALLVSRIEWEAAGGQELRRAAERLGIHAVGAFLDLATDDELRRVFKEMSKQGVDAVVVSGSGDLFAKRAVVVRLAHEHRLRVIYPYRDYVELGGLLSYAPDGAEIGERLAQAVAEVVQGANPGEVPIQQATKFALVINLTTAKGLGLTIPPALLARADEVIE